MDFREVAAKLRALMQANHPNVDAAASLAARKVATAAEREMAVQSLLYLVDHLTHYEQWKRAATLLAECIPALAETDPRVRGAVQEAAALAARMDTPERECAAFAEGCTASIPDGFAGDPNGLQGRGWYWLQVVRLVGAKASLEYGCSQGTNVFHCARVEPSVRWFGVDVSGEQVTGCWEQAKRLGLANAHFALPVAGGEADVVAVLDTIEHTVFDVELLREAERFLRPGGVVVVSAPNGPWSPHTANEAAPGQHVNVQTLTSFVRLLGGRGDLLDVQVLPGFRAEANSSLVGCYRPRAAQPARIYTVGALGDVYEPRFAVAVGERAADAVPGASGRVTGGEKALRGRRVAIAYLQESWWGHGLPANLLDDPNAMAAIAGGETYAMEAAFGLAEAGADVDFYSSLIAPGEYKGVRFLPAVKYLDKPPDAVLSLLSPFALQLAPRSAVKLFLQQCNDLSFPDDQLRHVDGVVAASAPHAEFLKSLGRYSGPYHVVHNGCYVERYEKNATRVCDRGPTVGYWSSPDRGLHHLLNAWPLVLRAVPEARLDVYYEIDRWKRAMEDRRKRGEWGSMPVIEQRYDEVVAALARAQDDLSVTFHGMLPKAKMIEAQKKTAVFCYPCDPPGGLFTEGFGSSVAEGLAAGCEVVMTDVDALGALYDVGDRDARILSVGNARSMYRLAEYVIGALSTARRSPLLCRGSRYGWHRTREAFVDLVGKLLADRGR